MTASDGRVLRPFGPALLRPESCLPELPALVVMTRVTATGEMTTVPSGVVRIGGAAAVAQAVALAASPILTRLYSPTDYAVLGVVTSISAIVAIFVTLRMDVAAMVPESETDAWLLRTIAVAASLPIGLLFAVPLAVFATSLSSALGVPSAAPYLWWCGPIAAVIGWYASDGVILARRSEHSRIAVRQVAQAIGQVVLSLALFPLGALGLVAGFGFGRLGAVLGRPRRPQGVTYSLHGMLALLSRYKRFTLVSTWSGVASVAGQTVLVLIVGIAFGQADAGQFTLAFRIMAAPVGLLSLAFSQVFIGEMTKRLASDGHVEAVVRRNVKQLLLVGGVPVLALGLVAPWGFPLVVAQVVVSPVSQVLNVFERQWLLLTWDASRVVLIAALPAVMAHGGWQAVPTIAATAWLGATLYGALLWLVLRVAATPTRQSGPHDVSGRTD